MERGLAQLSLLAEDSIYNRQGGILAGRDVDLTARSGDILNQRTVTRHESTLGNSRWESSFADSAARIEATRDLTLNAGRDVHNLGGVLESRGNLHISAGRDVTLAAMEERHSTSRGNHYLNSQTTQLSSETRADGNLSIQAGRDLTAIASRVESGQDMQLIASNDLTLASTANESHHYSKSKKATNQRDQVRQVGTEVNSGGQFTAVAGQDLTLVSSSVVANDEAYLVAGGKVQLLAAQDYDYSLSEKKKKGSFGRKSYRMSESDNSTAAVSSIQVGTDLLIHGAEAIVSQGAQLQAGQHLELQSGGDILLLAAENSSSQASAKSKSGLLSSKGKASSQSQTQVVGTTADAGSILIAAGQGLQVSAGDLRAQGDMALQAGRDVELSSATQYSSQSQSKHSSKLGFSHHALLTHTQKQQAAEQGSGTAVGSYLSADNLLISSGRDTDIQGSTLISERDMHIRAGRDLDIVSGENISHSSTTSSSKKTGEIGSWWQPAIGQVKQKVKTQGETLQQSGSQLASLTGNISLQAGETYQQTASNVLALEGDIHIQGKQVNVDAGYDQLSHSETRSANRTAVGGTVSIPVVNAIQGMQKVNKARERTDDPRMQALAAATLAMQGKAAYDGAQALYNGNVGGIKISLNLSNNSSKSQSTQQGQNVSASSVIAGGDIHVQATGAQDSDLNIIGSRLSAGQDIRLQADRNILLRAAENTAIQSSRDSGGGWSAGIGFGLGGSQNGFTLELAANQFRGKSDGNDSLWSNTQVEAGRKVHLESGADTRLQGAVVKGEQVTAEVGGNLLLESLQDRSTYQSRQSSSSAGVSLCIPPFCAGTSTASAGQSSSKARGDYASVNQQTGIQAGDGGFQLKVKGHTDLTGAVIASSEQAVQDGLNRLETGTLVVRDIENHAQAKASSNGLSLSSDMLTSGKYGIAKGVVGNELDRGAAKETSSGHSLSAISEGEILIKDEAGQLELTGQSAEETLTLLRRDTDNTHTAAERIDIRELERDAEAQRIIKQAVFAEAVKFTDETYRVMFLEEAKVYVVERDEEGKVKLDDNGYAVVRELSQSEKEKLGSDGQRVKVFNNGIFNIKEAAEGYAAQMLPGSDEQVYLIHFPAADNAVSELLVAGYQKFLENDFWGLANATLEAKDMMKLYGETGLDIAGHSRGSMTLLNAMQSLQKEGAVGSLSETMVHFFGPAASAQTAAKLLHELSGGKQDTVYLQNHKDDFVGTILGGNPATYDKVPEGSNKIKEWINMFNDQPTVHSCYGAGTRECDTAYGGSATVGVKYK